VDNWILIVVIVVVMLAAGLLRERWCVLRVERWARGRGFDVRSRCARARTAACG